MSWINNIVFSLGIAAVFCMHIWTIGDALCLILMTTAILFFYVRNIQLQKCINSSVKNKIYKPGR